MHTFLSILGLLVLLAGLCSAVPVAVAGAADALRRLHWRLTEDARLHERRSLGQMIADSHHWFSESDPAAAAFRALGGMLRDGYPYDASEVRYRWRRLLQSGDLSKDQSDHAKA
jgi:hypothetical protein